MNVLGEIIKFVPFVVRRDAPVALFEDDITLAVSQAEVDAWITRWRGFDVVPLGTCSHGKAATFTCAHAVYYASADAFQKVWDRLVRRDIYDPSGDCPSAGLRTKDLAFDLHLFKWCGAKMVPAKEMLRFVHWKELDNYARENGQSIVNGRGQTVLHGSVQTAPGQIGYGLFYQDRCAVQAFRTQHMSAKNAPDLACRQRTASTTLAHQSGPVEASSCQASLDRTYSTYTVGASDPRRATAEQITRWGTHACPFEDTRHSGFFSGFTKSRDALQ